MSTTSEVLLDMGKVVASCDQTYQLDATGKSTRNGAFNGKISPYSVVSIAMFDYRRVCQTLANFSKNYRTTIATEHDHDGFWLDLLRMRFDFMPFWVGWKPHRKVSLDKPARTCMVSWGPQFWVLYALNICLGHDLIRWALEGGKKGYQQHNI